ncbi:E3 ubiquitin-protein ligase MYLIP-like [Diadema antillarum]|uniref:E3 ubiquitin-protein ligase MYLIP-like n=1 Tax=Diadema antillarum TaxID=105358 RepID=UPI003A84AB87
MLVLVKKPDGHILEIEVGPKAVGQECLDLACNMLNMVEVDYFGLQFLARKGERHWLNLRNSITSQLPIGFSAPIRLELRVKFHVEPHILQQDITRHLFFHDAKLLAHEGKLKAPMKDAARLAAFFVQAEKGDFSSTNSDVEQLAQCFPQYQDSEEFKVTAQAEYARLRSMKQSHALVMLLREVCGNDTYGLDTFSAKGSSGQLYEVGVGPHGVLVTSADSSEMLKIPLACVKQLTVDKRDCDICYTVDDGHNFRTENLAMTLGSKELTEGIYRSVTEKVEFFTSETVSEPVKDTFVRDLRGSICSFLKMQTDTGKKYSFDLRRTQQEVHDQARRELFRRGITAQCAHSDLAAQANDRDNRSELEEQLQRYQDAVLCRVCMNAHLDTVLLPCGHLIICSTCAEMVSSCPSCRVDIVEKKRVYWAGDSPLRPC